MSFSQKCGDMPVLLLIISAVIVLITLAVVSLCRLIKRYSLKKVDNPSGFSYDPAQDIFYSDIDAWQRKFGYCQMYDEASPLLNMIIDCEPVRFRYGGKSWLIELWKGQYGMTTGAEIGVYYTRRHISDSQKSRGKALYKCVKDKDMLPMSIRLIKNGSELFHVEQRHWWLTGFVLGEFSNPFELQAVYSITFPCDEMKSAFVDALLDLGYSHYFFYVDGLTVRIIFTEPLSEQPYTRTRKREQYAQAVNKKLCELWDDVTGDFENSLTKLDFVREENPKMYDNALSFGKTPNRYIRINTALTKGRTQ